jgi:hypothetical protein
MAQWLGFGSGHTHETRVEDAEEALRHAVEVFRASVPEDERRKKTKAVKRLAGRVMWARMQLLKARIAAAQEAQMGGALAERSKQIASLQHQAEVVLEGGISAILAEFGAQDATVPGTPDP